MHFQMRNERTLRFECHYFGYLQENAVDFTALEVSIKAIIGFISHDFI